MVKSPKSVPIVLVTIILQNKNIGLQNFAATFKCKHHLKQANKREAMVLLNLPRLSGTFNH